MTLQEELEKLHRCVNRIKYEFIKAFPILQKIYKKEKPNATEK